MLAVRDVQLPVLLWEEAVYVKIVVSGLYEALSCFCRNDGEAL